MGKIYFMFFISLKFDLNMQCLVCLSFAFFSADFGGSLISIDWLIPWFPEKLKVLFFGFLWWLNMVLGCTLIQRNTVTWNTWELMLMKRNICFKEFYGTFICLIFRGFSRGVSKNYMINLLNSFRFVCRPTLDDPTQIPFSNRTQHPSKAINETLMRLYGKFMNNLY